MTSLLPSCQLFAITVHILNMHTFLHPIQGSKCVIHFLFFLNPDIHNSQDVDVSGLPLEFNIISITIRTKSNNFLHAQFQVMQSSLYLYLILSPYYHFVPSAKSADGRLQLNTHAPSICGFKWSGTLKNWCMAVWCTQNLCQDSISFKRIRHVRTKQHCKYTTSVDIKKTCHKRIQSLIQNHMGHDHSESALEQRLALYKSDQ